MTQERQPFTVKDYAKLVGTSSILGLGSGVLGSTTILEVAGRDPDPKLFIAGAIVAAAGYVLSVGKFTDLITSTKVTK